MAPSSFSKHRFQNSLDLAAARSMRNVGRNDQSGTGNAWCIMDSPTLGRMSSVSRQTQEMQPVASSSQLTVPVADIAPLNIKKNIKKIRRRGLVSGVHLVLPPSPLPLGSSLTVPTPRTASTPGTALTFTAEWDLTQKTFVFTPFESEHPQTAISPKFILSPIPLNVDDDTFPTSPPPMTPPAHSPYAPSRSSSIQAMISPHFRRSWSGNIAIATDEETPSRSGDTSSSEPSTPVSPIFDSPGSLYSHGRKGSHSTAASSVTDLSLPEVEKPAPQSAGEDEGDVLHIFQVELRPVAPTTAAASELSPETYKDLDHDLVSSPMVAFEKTLWEATLPDTRAVRKATMKRPLTLQRKPLTDLPSSAFSVYSLEPAPSSLGGSPSSLKGSLRQQISKAFSSTLHFKR